MKRDMELVREVLLAVEQLPPNRGGNNVEIPGRDEEEVNYHIGLLEQAGLLEVYTVGIANRAQPYRWPTQLTWAGHDFLDAARNDSLWRKAVAKVKDEGGTWSIAILKSLLAKYAAEKLGISVPG